MMRNKDKFQKSSEAKLNMKNKKKIQLVDNINKMYKMKLKNKLI